VFAPGGTVPTYQYVCTECGGQLEAVQKFTDEPLTVHDDCGGRLRKVFSPVGIVFKGSGFYRTDSRSGGSSSAASGAAAKAGSDASTAADSKPAGDSSAKSGSDSVASTASSSNSSSGEKVA
jgi:putative FmdB family regulatory protein